MSSAQNRVAFTVMLQPQEVRELRRMAERDCASASAWARRVIVRALAREREFTQLRGDKTQ